MNTLDREMETLRPILGAATDPLLQRERRETFSIYPELRFLSWAGVMLLVTAAGMLIAEHFEVIGSHGLAAMIAMVAVVAYAWAWEHRNRTSLVDDYVLLLAALLLSADVAFVETQFKLLGGAWSRHLLLLAVVHGATAYVFNSRMVLSLSISALAGWIGVERGALDPFSQDPIELASRAFTCAAALIMCRALDARYRDDTTFRRTFEHFAANVALWGGLSLMADDSLRVAACLLTLAIAVAVAYWGIRTESEPFVLYAFIYAVIAVNVLLIDTIGGELAALLITFSIAGSIAGLVAIHFRFRRAFA